jgi:hypothetical protein
MRHLLQGRRVGKTVAEQSLVSADSQEQFDDLVSGWQPPSLFLRIDFMVIDEDVECAWAAHANASGNLQLAFDALFQAHGPSADITSKETALDFHNHSWLSQILPYSEALKTEAVRPLTTVNYSARKASDGSMSVIRRAGR